MSKFHFDNKNLNCVVLNGKDTYNVWAFTVKEHLKTMKLSNIVCESEVSPKEEDETREQIQQAKSWLLSVISPDEIAKITHCVSAREIWQYFQSAYGAKTSNIKLELMSELSKTNFSSAQEVVDGINKILATRGKLRQLEVVIDDVTILDIIIKALPPNFANFLSNWQMLDAEQQTLGRLISKLNEKAREVAEAEENTIALLAANQSRGATSRFIGAAKPLNKRWQLNPRYNARGAYQTNERQNFAGGVSNPQANKIHSLGGNSYNNKPQVVGVCNYCKKPGHWKADCRKLKHKEQQDNAMMIAFPASSELANSGSCPIKSSDPIWIVDSGCSYHMTPNKHWITDLRQPTMKIKIRIGDGTCLRAAGIGNVITDYGVLNVFYVPNISANLFSVSSAMRANHKVVFADDGVSIEYEDRIITKGTIINGVSVIHLPMSHMANLSETTLDIWHKKLGHAPKDIISKMVNLNLVRGLRVNSNKKDICVDCKLNKCKHSSHPLRSSQKASKSGAVLHADLIGPIRPDGLRNERYILVCKDEYSTMVITACLMNKAQTPEIMKQILTKVELQTKNPVLKLVTDNGSEFVNDRLASYLINKGILHAKSAPYVHQQNGTVERENQSILNRARTILNASKLNQRLWPEAVATACYISNRVITSTKEVTPYEKWYNEKPDVSNMQPFGQQAIVMNHDHLRSKFDTKGVIMNFVGYTESFNTYKFFDPKTNNLFISCDVVFLDELGPQTSERAAKPYSYSEAMGSSEIERRTFDFTIIDPEVDIENSNTEISHKTQTLESDELVNIERDNMSIREIQEPTGVPVNNSISTIQNVSDNLQPDDGSPMDSDRNELDNLAEPDFNDTTFQSAKSLGTTFNSETNKLPELDLDISNDRTLTKSSTPLTKSKSSDNLIINRPKRAINRPDYKQLNKGVYENKNYLSMTVEAPTTYEEALSSEDKELWRQAFDEEMSSLIANNVFETCERPNNSNIVGSRWVLTYKTMPDGGVKPKARLVAKGYLQQYGIDYNSTFAPVVDMNSVRFLFAIIALKRLNIVQVDVKTAFLNGDLDEIIYMDAPEGFETDENKVWRLKKSLYGLKQSPRKWNEKFTIELEKLGFNQIEADRCIFYKKIPFVIIAIYVDDVLICSKSLPDSEKTVEELRAKFEIRKIGNGKFLGFQYQRLSDDGVILYQKDYIERMLAKYGMNECQTVPTPFEVGQRAMEDQNMVEQSKFREIVGSLQYLACQTRPDIAFTVNYLSRNVLCPNQMHWKILKRTLRYLRGTENLGIAYMSTGCKEFIAYSDADYAGDMKSYKSTTGQVVLLADGPISWKSKLQKINVTSTTEAEYIALASTTKTVISLRNLSNQLGLETLPATAINCDNRGAVAIATNEASAQRTRHLGAQLFFTRDQQERKNIEIQWIQSTDQLADVFTKPLNKEKHTLNVSKLMTTLLCMLTCTSILGQEIRPQRSVELVQVNSMVWTDMQKMINVGLLKQKYSVKIPNYCDQIKKKRLSIKDNTLAKMMEKAETSCNHMRRDIYLPNLRSLENFKFNQERSKRDVRSTNITELDAIAKIAQEKPREAAGGWDVAGAAFPLIGPMVQSIVQHSKEDSAYNTVWKHDREMKQFAKGLVEVNNQMLKQAGLNNYSVQSIVELNNATNVLFGQVDYLKKASPEIAELISKTTVNIYRDADLLRDIKFGFEKGVLNHDALRKMGFPNTGVFTNIEYTLRYSDTPPPCRMLNFKINWTLNEMEFIFAYPIYDRHTFIYETISMRDFVDNTTYRIFPEKLYAIHNTTANCSKLISPPPEKKELIGFYCKTVNLTLNSPNISLEHVKLDSRNNHTWFQPQIIEHGYDLYIQCFGNNLTIEGSITQKCPKFPFTVPSDFNYEIGEWHHRFDYTQSKIEARNLSIDDISEIEHYYPWITTFQSQQNRVRNMERLNEEIVQISERKLDPENNIWSQLQSNIGTLFHLNPFLFTGLSGFSVVGFCIILVFCYYQIRRDPLIEIAQTSMIASIMGPRQPSCTSLPEATSKPSVNIAINNQVIYPNLIREEFRQTPYPSQELTKVEKNDTIPEEGTHKNFDKISFCSLPADLEQSTFDAM